MFSFTFNIYLMDKLTISQSSLPIYLMTLMVTMPKHKQCFKHVRTSWTLASEQYIKYFRQWKYYVKYLYISNIFLTMMLTPEKKIILRFFFWHKLIYLCAKFQLSQTPATGFLPINITSFANIGLEYFSNNILRVFH